MILSDKITDQMNLEQPKAADVLQKLKTARCSYLTFYFDNIALFNGIASSEIDQILNAYYSSYSLVLRKVFVNENKSIDLNKFPNSNIVLTQSPTVFKSLYPNPSLFDSLPYWVRGYANISQNVYVRWFSEEESLKILDPNGACHEFLHLIIPEVFNIPAKYLAKFWPIWVREGFSVGLSQIKPIEWTAAQFRIENTNIPTAKSIENKGIFYYNQKTPENNPIYQYCYWLTNEVGKLFIHKFSGKLSQITPLAAIGWLTNQAYHDGILTLKDALQNQNIDLSQAESNCQKLFKST
jgi:hypothetical protein